MLNSERIPHTFRYMQNYTSSISMQPEDMNMEGVNKLFTS